MCNCLDGETLQQKLEAERKMSKMKTKELEKLKGILLYITLYLYIMM